MGDSTLSADPFSDRFAVSSSPINTVLENYVDFTITTNEPYSQIATRPDKMTIPILDRLSPVSPWTPLSGSPSLSMVSIAPTSPATEMTVAPIPWNNADLMYLLNIIYPSELRDDALLFSPSLETLDTTPTPFTLHLYYYKHPTPPPSHAFSKDAPIGTGRPISTLLLIASAPPYDNPTAARQHLAQRLLSNEPLLRAAVDRYNVLATLHSLPTPSLLSVHRSLQLMTCVTNEEWEGRLRQLSGFVDENCVGLGVDVTDPVEARLERFFLRVGRRAVHRWIKDVGVASEQREWKRRDLERVYAEVVAFLVRAVEEGAGVERLVAGLCWAGDIL